MFFFYVPQIPSLSLSGEQSSLYWAISQSENRSNHLFIDWNIRGLRGSGGERATKSEKYRATEGRGRKRRIVVGVSQMEWRSKEGKLLSEKEVGSLA